MITTTGISGLLLLVGCTDNPSQPAASSDSPAPSAETTDNSSDVADTGDPTDTSSSSSAMAGKMAMPDPDSIQFRDDVSTNAEVPAGLDGLMFIDTKGNRVALEDYLGERHVILVFTEGFAGMLCPFCKTQTSRLVANYDRFAELDTEILVVYPGERDHLDEFLEAARTTGQQQVDRVPFPIVLDQEMEAVEFFDIKSSLAHPSTYVIDKLGNVQLAYVGADMSADRPSVNALLDTIRHIATESTN